jgi:hypothetical protein
MYARDSGSMSVVVGERGVNVCFRTSTKLKETISQRLVFIRECGSSRHASMKARRALLGLQLPSSRTLCNADNFKGPGGLSARDIMAKIQEAKARDAGVQPAYAKEIGRAAAARAASAQKAAAPPPEASTSTVSVGRLQAMSSAELVSLLVSRGVEFSDCYEHQDLLDRAIGRLGESKVPRHHPAAGGRANQARGKAVDRSALDRPDDL